MLFNGKELHVNPSRYSALRVFSIIIGLLRECGNVKPSLLNSWKAVQNFN